MYPVPTEKKLLNASRNVSNQQHRNVASVLRKRMERNISVRRHPKRGEMVETTPNEKTTSRREQIV
jgi:hypothetical protein